jgi:hypothetical protein
VDRFDSHRAHGNDGASAEVPQPVGFLPVTIVNLC